MLTAIDWGWVARPRTVGHVDLLGGWVDNDKRYRYEFQYTHMSVYRSGGYQRVLRISWGGDPPFCVGYREPTDELRQVQLPGILEVWIDFLDKEEWRVAES